MEEKNYGTIAIEKIQPGYNPRKNFDDLGSLKESIKEKGILTPITVRPRNEHYEIVCGERRYRCAKDLGLTEIPVFIKPMDDETAEDVAFIENKERNNLNPIEEAEFFKYKKETYNLTLLNMVEKGYAKAHPLIIQKLSLLDLPNKIREIVARATISERHGYEITKLLDQEALTKLFEDNKLFIKIDQPKKKKVQPKEDITQIADEKIVETADKSIEDLEKVIELEPVKADWEIKLQEEMTYRQNMQIKLANQVIENEMSVKTLQAKIKGLLTDLKKRDENILEGIMEEKERQKLFDGIYFKSSENMAELKDGSIHIIVTSPPYFAGKEYEKDLTFGDYKILLANVIKECDRVLCKGGIIALNIGDIPNLDGKKYLIGRLIEDALTENLFIKDSIIWKKDDPWQSNPHVKFQEQEGKYRILPSTEHIFLIYKKGSRTVSATQKLESQISKDAEWTPWVSGWWDIPSVRSNKEHPSMFPEELPKRLIKMYSFKGDNVLDPFLGSGTTVKVARELGRLGFGYEKEEKYKEVIEKRLKELYKKEDELELED